MLLFCKIILNVTVMINKVNNFVAVYFSGIVKNLNFLPLDLGISLGVAPLRIPQFQRQNVYIFHNAIKITATLRSY